MIKNLIFYWYIPKSITLPDIYQLHIYNLKKYSKIFDNATFILSIDNILDVNKINDTKKIINDLGFKCSIKYLLYKNDNDSRECLSFYNEVIQNLKNLEGITFFGHTKGTTRKTNSSVPMWTTGLYYFNLNDIKSVEKELSKSDIYSYGVFKKKYTWIIEENNKVYVQKYDWHYSGTFFWINSQKIVKYIEKNKIETSVDIHRWYAEMWLGNLFNESYAYNRYVTMNYDGNLYEDCKNVLEKDMKVPQKELNSFLKYFNKMNEELHIDFNKKENDGIIQSQPFNGCLNFMNPYYEEPPKNTGLKKLIFK